VDGRNDVDVARPGAGVVGFTSEMTPELLTQVLAGGTLTTPLALTIMLAGPLFVVMGALMRGQILLQWGYTLLAALPAMPLLAFGVAYVNARRKSASEIIVPLEVRADAEGLTLRVGEDTRVAPWSAFQRWRRMMGTHLLYTGLRTFMVLRTDGLDAEQRATFEGLLRANIPSGPRR